MSELSILLEKQKEWSGRTFGEGLQTEKICNHISKELQEIKDCPSDTVEWLDVVLLALDGAWRTGASTEEIIQTLLAKQEMNTKREWVKPEIEGQPYEHKR